MCVCIAVIHWHIEHKAIVEVNVWVLILHNVHNINTQLYTRVSHSTSWFSGRVSSRVVLIMTRQVLMMRSWRWGCLGAPPTRAAAASWSRCSPPARAAWGRGRPWSCYRAPRTHTYSMYTHTHTHTHTQTYTATQRWTASVWPVSSNQIIVITSLYCKWRSLKSSVYFHPFTFAFILTLTFSLLPTLSLSLLSLFLFHSL